MKYNLQCTSRIRTLVCKKYFIHYTARIVKFVSFNTPKVQF